MTETPEERRARQSTPEYRAARGTKWKTIRRNRDASGNITGKVQVPVQAVEPTRINPATIKRTSTLTNADGRITQWVIEEPEAKARLELWQQIAAEFKSGIVRVKPVPAPATSNDNLLVEYGVGDHHMGMLSWKAETGAHYDLEIGEGLLVDAFTYLTSVAPPAPKAVIEFIGDLFHYDSPIPKTLMHGNVLDADGRYQKMVRATIRAVRRSIDLTLLRHQFVRVILEVGNHDPYSIPFLMECLDIAYENEPRVTIDTSPMYYHYFRHGKCLVGTHHGHMAKPEALPGIMSADRAEDWGQTTHRFWRTGHVHSKNHWDFPGCSVESYRILPPPDAWAYQKGYRSHRGMEAIVLHDTFGEVARYPVTPEMLAECK